MRERGSRRRRSQEQEVECGEQKQACLFPFKGEYRRVMIRTMGQYHPKGCNGFISAVLFLTVASEPMPKGCAYYQRTIDSCGALHQGAYPSDCYYTKCRKRVVFIQKSDGHFRQQAPHSLDSIIPLKGNSTRKKPQSSPWTLGETAAGEKDRRRWWDCARLRARPWETGVQQSTPNRIAHPKWPIAKLMPECLINDPHK